MKKVLLSILSLGVIGAASAQVVTDTIVTGTGYLDQHYYKLEDGTKTVAGAKDWHIAFGTVVGQQGVAIRFNSLAGNVRVLPNASVSTSITSVDTTGYAASTVLHDNDADRLEGAFNKSADGVDQFDFSWGQYNMSTHNVDAKRTYAAKIGTDIYAIRFKLASMSKLYTLTYAKLGETDSVTYNLDMNNYSTKGFVYTNIITQDILDLEPAKTEWDLFFGQYYTALNATMNYSVAGVLNNKGTEVAEIITADPANYSYTGTETFATENNVIGWDGWKSSGQSGVSISDTSLFIVKAIDGSIWKVIFTDFVSGTNTTSAIPGAYVMAKEKISTVGVNNETAIFTEVYPNPAADVAQVVVDATSETTISIFTLTGAKVYETTVNGGLQTVNVATSDLTNGLYQVVVSSNGMSTAKKLMIQH